MAFLHRVVNGGGTLDREYAIGSDRMDICLRYGKTTLGMELKVWRDPCGICEAARGSDPLAKGLVQLEGYLARLGLEAGWLVIFDQRSGQPSIEERTTTTLERTAKGRIVTVIRA
jgi:hypothetical protein